MRWIARKKRLGDVRPGDKTIDIDGRVSTVVSKTTPETPDELYRITLIAASHVDNNEDSNEDNNGDRNETIEESFLADAGHAWPLDPSSTHVPFDHRGETEASTGDIAAWVSIGLHPVLAPMILPSDDCNDDTTVMRWIVKNCVLCSDAITNDTMVQCLRVDAPSHTFMLAPTTDDTNGSIIDDITDDTNDDISGDNEVINDDTVISDKTIRLPSSTGTGSFYDVSDADYSEIMSTSVPTHNCGGPLTLDTVIPLANGESTTMGAIRVGDWVMGPDGPTLVTEISEPMTPVHLYGIESERYDGDDTPEWTVGMLEDAEQEYENGDTVSI